MKNVQKTLWFVVLCAITAWPQLPVGPVEVTGWKMQDSAAVGPTSGQTISTSAYTGSSSWYNATVPGTALRTLVDNGVYPDQFIGLNMLATPDIANQQRRWWFRSTFTVNAAVGERVWLDVGSINYIATIYVNGTQLRNDVAGLQPYNPNMNDSISVYTTTPYNGKQHWNQIGTMYGAYKERKFDITNLVNIAGGTNYIAIKIQGNLNQGVLHTKYTGMCGNNGGNMSADGPTPFQSQGWDWLPTIPDRDMGILHPVYIRVTGNARLVHPWVRTLNIVTTPNAVSALTGYADIPIQVDLKNPTGTAVTGTVKCDIDGTIQLTDQPVTINPMDSAKAIFPTYRMMNPILWWPNEYGDQHLYTLHMSFIPTGSTTPADTLMLKFGVRQFGYNPSAISGWFVVYCNGVRILYRGGSMGMDDAMKTWDMHKLKNRLLYHKEQHFNGNRDWCGSIDNEQYYQYCDSLGIMVWADFWQPHSADRPVASLDDTNYYVNMRDKFLRVRNHASLLLWEEANETTATTQYMNYMVHEDSLLDGTRWDQNNSGAGGVHSGGPYNWTPIAGCYAAISGHHTEFGGPTIESPESMNEFVVPANLYQAYPFGWHNEVWSFHDFCYGGSSADVFFTNAGMVATFPTPGVSPSDPIYGCANFAEFVQKGFVMSYNELKAEEETESAKRWTGCTGLSLWMSNCVWPSMMWETYDYYQEPSAAFFGARHGSEPIHIMYYGPTSGYQVQAVNNTRFPLTKYTVKAASYNLDGSVAWSNSKSNLTVAADTIVNIFFPSPGTTTPWFLDLNLYDSTGMRVSHNFYWQPMNGTNIYAMFTMAKTRVDTVRNSPQLTGGWHDSIDNSNVHNLTFKIKNYGTVPAVFNRIRCTRKPFGGDSPTTGGYKFDYTDRILPIHFSDNYFSLAPGDSQTITIKFDDADLGAGNVPFVSIEGINVPLDTIKMIDLFVSVLPHNNLAGSTPKAGIYTIITGNNLKLCNVPTGCPWELCLYTLQGQTVLKTGGVAKSNAIMVSTAHILPGVFVSVLKSAGQIAKSVVTIRQ